MAEGPIPKNWSEATPAIVWVILIFAAGFEFISCLVHAEWWSCAASFALLVIMTAALIHWRHITRWGPLAYALATLLVVISVGSPLLDRALPQTRQENQPGTEFEAQKSTLIEWLQQSQRERDEVRQELAQAKNRVPNPVVCADLLRQMGAPPPDPKKHEWNVFGQDQVKEDVRSVMKNLGCFAPEK